MLGSSATIYYIFLFGWMSTYFSNIQITIKFNAVHHVIVARQDLCAAKNRIKIIILFFATVTKTEAVSSVILISIFIFQVRYDSLCLSHNRMQSVLYVSCRSLQVIYSKWCWLFWKCQSLLFLRHTGTSCQFASMEYYCSPDFLFYLHDIQYLGLLCLKKHLYIQYLTGSTCFT